MKRTFHAILSIAIFAVSASTFAANPCIDYAVGANAAIEKYINATRSYVYKNIYFNRKGNFALQHAGEDYDFILKTYTLPSEVSKKVYYRFTDATTKGTRTSNGRLVCSFSGEFGDGHGTGTDVRNFDVNTSAGKVNVSMEYSPGEPRGGSTFDPAGIGQWVLNSAIFYAAPSDPEYQAQMAKFH